LGVTQLRPSFFQRPKAAGHGDDVGVTELLEGLGREGRAGSAGAVHDDRRVVVRDLVLDLALEGDHSAG